MEHRDRAAHVPVVHDCDNALGLLARDVDDGLALLYLLARPEIDLLAVTTCFGNAPLRRVVPATRRLLDHVGRPDVPLLAGASRPGAAATPAALRLVELVRRRPGRVTVVATGPLTNVAAAAALDPGFLARVGRLVCLGGNLGPARLGWRPVNELNFGADPAAAAAVLAAADCCPLTLVPATSCLAARFRRADLERLAHLGPAFLRAVARWLHCCRLGRGLDHFVLWDLLPVVWLTHPGLFVTRRASVSLGPGARLAATEGDRHELVLGLRDPEALREAFFDALATLAVPAAGRLRVAAP